MEKITYHSFLLKMWLMKHNEKLSWLASIEDTHTGEQQHFNCFEDLFIYFQQLKKELESNVKET